MYIHINYKVTQGSTVCNCGKSIQYLSLGFWERLCTYCHDDEESGRSSRVIVGGVTRGVSTSDTADLCSRLTHGGNDTFITKIETSVHITCMQKHV